jgi:ABC-type antimicrobial peptide transport system permease subunit
VSFRQFFLLMQGYLALGLLVGITGLGVVMVRAVRERRRTIAVLRALGFRAATVRRSFLTESGFVAFEGVIVGTVLGVTTTWLFYQSSAAFAGRVLPDRVGCDRHHRWGHVGCVPASDTRAGAASRTIHPALALRIAD